MVKYILFILIAVNIVCLGFFPYLETFLYFSPLYFLTFGYILFDIQKEKKRTRDDILKRIDDKIWEIPVKLKCKHCSNTEDVNFDLETRYFQCSSCTNYNKIFLTFNIIPESKTSLSDEYEG